MSDNDALRAHFLGDQQMHLSKPKSIHLQDRNGNMVTLIGVTDIAKAVADFRANEEIHEVERIG